MAFGAGNDTCGECHAAESRSHASTAMAHTLARGSEDQILRANPTLTFQDGAYSYTIRQGVELLRPSTLECTVSAVDGQATRVTVGGTVVPIASGQIAVPPFVG